MLWHPHETLVVSHSSDVEKGMDLREIKDGSAVLTLHLEFS